MIIKVMNKLQKLNIILKYHNVSMVIFFLYNVVINQLLGDLSTKMEFEMGIISCKLIRNNLNGISKVLELRLILSHIVLSRLPS